MIPCVLLKYIAQSSSFSIFLLSRKCCKSLPKIVPPTLYLLVIRPNIFRGHKKKIKSLKQLFFASNFTLQLSLEVLYSVQNIIIKPCFSSFAGFKE